MLCAETSAGRLERGIFTMGIVAVVLFYNAPVPLLLFVEIDIIGFPWMFVTHRKTTG
ncbi:hypothetical protein L0Y40_00315 [Candidatus Wolfebacteria bacterium]|nr:hypothetical protein [Candidatus Wolfebacteria bacterium]